MNVCRRVHCRGGAKQSGISATFAAAQECVKALSGLLIKVSMEGDEKEDAMAQIEKIMSEVVRTCRHASRTLSLEVVVRS